LRTFCSTISTVVPASAMRRAMASSSSTMRGARPSDGSSSISRRGALIIARATATICCSPPLIVPASCAGALGQLGEVLQAWRSRAPARPCDQPAAELEVLGHRHLREQLPAFGHQHQAPLDDGMVLASGRSLAVEPHVALARDQAVDRLQQRGLAGAVGAQDHRQAGARLQRQVAQHQEGAVAGRQALDLQVRQLAVERGFDVVLMPAASVISSPR
jgi:hypothetical protein